MGIDIFALRKQKVQLNSIDNLHEKLQQKEYIDSHQIWSIWSDSDINLWPKCLQQFWWKIYDYDSAQFCAKKIRKYYSNDIDLLQFASWLETFDEDTIFEISF